MTFEEIDNLHFYDYQNYIDAMNRIEAQETLLKMNLADYPNMGREDRRKFHRNLHDIAYPPQEQKLQTTADLMRFLNG